MLTRSNHITGLLVLLIVLTMGSSLTAADFTETYFKFQTPDRPLLDKLSRIISIDNVRDGEVFAYANSRELADFERFGLAYEVLPHPGKLIVPRMSTEKAVEADWDVYPTHDAYLAMMYQFETDYPGLCEIVNAGSSVEGRPILFARISDNVAVEEDEPEVMYTSSMHGDETTGYILCLRLIDSLLVSYGSDAFITRMVDSCEIWINPLANPDGAYHSGDHTIYGARRYNSNGVDLNRNFPDPLDGDHPDGNPWQPETILMMDFAEAHSIAVSSNFHGGAEVLNYPWDTWDNRHPDEDWYIDLLLAWASVAQAASPTSYLQSYQFPTGVTNGYDWYRVAGGRQDYMIYWRGCREMTAELSNVKLLPASELPDHWDWNKVGLLDYLESGLYGVRGIVTDQTTGLPLNATIHVLSHDIDNTQVYTDPDVGDYHRMLSAGTYDLEFSSLGFQPQTVNAVTVTDGLSVRVDVALVPLSGDPVLAYADNDVELVGRGDAVSMTLTVVNDGGGNANDVTGVLLTTDPHLTITQSTASFPMIPGLGGSAISSTDFEFTVSPTCPLNHYAEFQLDLTASGGYAETVTFGLMIEPLVEDYESGTWALFPWQMDGSHEWSIVLTDVSEGSFAVGSGPIADNQSSSLTLPIEVAQPGKLWFDYKVSSEASYDYLLFRVDGATVASWSGETNWTRVSFSLAAGPHTLSWSYEKDGGVSDGQDRAWLDRIVFPALVSTLQVATASPLGWTIDQPYSHQLETSGSLGTTIWSDRDGDLASTGLTLSSVGLLSGTPTATGLIQFTARVEDGAGTPAEKALDLNVNAAPQITTVSLPDGERDLPYEYQLTVSDGTAPFVWSDEAGDLTGTGLTLNSEGLLSGTPLVTGVVVFTTTVTDAAGATDAVPLSLTVTGGCCVGIVGDANGLGGDEPTIGDVSAIVDAKFITGDCDGILDCLAEADINQSGGIDPVCDDITIGDISILIDNLFITGALLPECL